MKKLSIKNTIIQNIKSINIKKFFILFSVLITTLLLDLLTKFYVCRETIDRAWNDPIVVIPKVLSFTYSENTGASWGLFGNHTDLLSLFTILLTITLIIFLLLSRKSHFLMQLSLTLIISGGIGNIYDRLKFGYVRDFIDYTFFKTLFNYDFPICNFADLVLVIGCCIMMVFIIFFYNKHYDKVKKEKVHTENNSNNTDDIQLENSCKEDNRQENNSNNNIN